MGNINWYAGIGSRTTPDHVLIQMHDIATILANAGWGLRSGAAPGADTAFEIGCNAANGQKEIFLPWKGFNGSDSPHFHIPGEAFEISREAYGPRLDFMKRPVKLLMARNVLQVLGPTLDDPCKFVVCFTPDGITHGSQRGKQTGGTGQAISIASNNNVPVFNLQSMPLEEVWDNINEIEKNL